MGFTSNSKIISVVVDNNILMDLWELGRLDLLFDSFDNVLIPEIIYDNELLDEIRRKIEEYNYSKINISTETGYEIYFKLTENQIYRNLSKADKIAVSCAKQESVFLTSNDGLVRKACDEYGIEYLGILGVLNYSHKEQLIMREELSQLCRNLMNTSCFITEKVIEEFLKSI